MKLSLYPLVVALAAFATAESFENVEDFETEEFDVRDVLRGKPKKCNPVAKMIPKCARPAIEKCNRKAGCSTYDYKCGCKHKKEITKCATGPVLQACSQSDALKARKAAIKLCKCAK